MSSGLTIPYEILESPPNHSAAPAEDSAPCFLRDLDGSTIASGGVDAGWRDPTSGRVNRGLQMKMWNGIYPTASVPSKLQPPSEGER